MDIIKIFSIAVNGVECKDRYLLRYEKFINCILESRENVRFSGSEGHHILPKCMGGVDHNNIIYLSRREHFIAHIILAKAFPGHTIAYALTRMNVDLDIKNSRFYDIARKLHGIAASNRAGRYRAVTDGKSSRYIGVNDEMPSGWKLGSVPRGYTSNKNMVMINDGVSQTFCPVDEIPLGWVQGRLPLDRVDMIRINNGQEERCWPKNEDVPSGWQRGRLNPTTLDTIIINNGSKECFHKISDEIPSGWVKGRLGPGPNNGRRWVNNGSISKFLKTGEDIPDGFVEGRLGVKKGKFWVCNGSESIFLNPDDDIPPGFKKGRKIKKD